MRTAETGQPRGRRAHGRAHPGSRRWSARPLYQPLRHSPPGPDAPRADRHHERRRSAPPRQQAGRRRLQPGVLGRGIGPHDHADMSALEIVTQRARGGADVDHGAGQHRMHRFHPGRGHAGDPAFVFLQVRPGHPVGERVDIIEQLVADGFHLKGESGRLDQPFTGAQEHPGQVRVPDTHRPQHPVQGDGALDEIPYSVQRLVTDRGGLGRRVGQAYGRHPDQRPGDVGLGVLDQAFDVPGVAVGAHDPGQGALDHPPFLERYEAVRVLVSGPNLTRRVKPRVHVPRAAWLGSRSAARGR